MAVMGVINLNEAKIQASSVDLVRISKILIKNNFRWEVQSDNVIEASY